MDTIFIKQFELKKIWFTGDIMQHPLKQNPSPFLE